MDLVALGFTGGECSDMPVLSAFLPDIPSGFYGRFDELFGIFKTAGF